MKLIFFLVGINVFLITLASATISISPTILEAETQINEQKDYQITITNNYNFDILDFSFGDLESKGFTFPNITIEKNSSKDFTILFKPTISIHENLQVPISFYWFKDFEEGVITEEINITDPLGFVPNHISIKQGDSIKFNNNHPNNFDVVIEGNSYYIASNSSITHQFNTLGLITYTGTFGFHGTIGVVNNSIREKIENPNYNINWAVNINAILNPTTLSVDNQKRFMK